MAQQAPPDRARAIAEFAATLRELRCAAGNPSFREMSGRSRAISHTTLHEAAQGNRLPSWSTTVEFVKACGADPAQVRDRWVQANHVVRAAGGSAQADDEAVDEPPADDATPAPAAAPGPEAVGAAPPTRSRRRWPAAAAAVVALAGGTTIGWLAHSGDGDRSPRPVAVTTAAAYTAVDCPVHKANPAPAAPLHPGDASRYVADLTLPDCMDVPRGATLTKTWRIRNAGTVAWRGYALHRIDPDRGRTDCQTITDVPVPATPAGALVDISVQVTTPQQKAFCFVRFKMLDGDGRFAFSGSRPLNFQLVVP